MKPHPRHHQRARKERAFTRADVCAVLMGLAVLALLALPALGKMKPQSDRVGCANNLRQIGLALAMYSADNHGQFPLRRTPNAWPTKLFPYYKDLRLLVCPIDKPYTNTGIQGFQAERALRSYIFNGWFDYYFVRFGASLQSTPFQLMSTNAINSADFPQPADTIAFGEKTSESMHMTVDLDGYDDIYQIEQARHDQSRQTPQTGGSNHAMVDGQVRYLKYGAGLAPVNLWAVTEQYRTNAIIVMP